MTAPKTPTADAHLHLRGMSPLAIANVARCDVADLRRLAADAGVELPDEDGEPMPVVDVQRCLSAIDAARGDGMVTICR